MSARHTGIGRFTSEKARQAFQDAYERAMALWPDDREALDIGTSYGTTRVYRHGAGPGRPIVLLHGHGGNASNWYGLVSGLGLHSPVYAIDTVHDPGGSVQTSPLPDPAVWLEEVLAGLDLDDVHLVGHSYGGWLALGLAVRGSGRLSALTLLDPGGLEKVPARFLLGLVAALFAMRAPPSWKPRLARLLADAALVERPEIMAPVMVGVWAFRSDRTPTRPYTDEELRRVTVPTQVILGGRSRMLRPARALARARLMGSLRRAVIVPGVGHGVPQEVPELVCERITGFGGLRLEETP
ncbi:alpha/beta fold hydrolase [Nonomuraea sp. LPB2021202275-12-8]|uniref:alpha/beta fold hydrolase n=1 Tax=Nonomuraea sp. LPB2021202275-12-8 TaxID=3120159 RepID=UPI00300CFDED